MIPKRIEIDAFLKELGDASGGQSRPVLVIGDDQNTYILKTERTSQGHWNAMFLQELLVSQLASFLGIPVPDCAIAAVDQLHLTHAPSLVFAHRFTPGLHFASRYLDGVENNLLDGFRHLMELGKPYVKTSWKNFFENVVNPSVAPNIIVLDLLTGNFDRFGNFGNLMVAKLEGSRTIFVIDHGHCFGGPAWTPEKIQFLTSPSNQAGYIAAYGNSLAQSRGADGMYTGLGQIFRVLDSFITITETKNPFLPSVRKLGELNESTIRQWFRVVPDEWFVDRNIQTAMYTDFLLKQRDAVPEILDHLARYGAFTNHIGGVLNWNVKATGTQ